MFVREAIEHRLVREGFSLADLRGVEEETVVHTERRDLLARLRRACPWVADPPPVTNRYTRRRPGISEREAIRYLTMAHERDTMEREAQEADTALGQGDGQVSGAARSLLRKQGGRGGP